MKKHHYDSIVLSRAIKAAGLECCHDEQKAVAMLQAEINCRAKDVILCGKSPDPITGSHYCTYSKAEQNLMCEVIVKHSLSFF